MTPSRSKIPRATVKRLSLYLRELESRHNQSQKTINSKQLGEVLSLTDAQVRKDLAYFGQFGYPGVGYKILELIENLRRILGTDRKWNALVIGAGNIGRAVMAYQRFRQKGFEVVAVLDSDRSVVGQVISGHHVRPMSDLSDLVVQRDIKIGILAVPAPVAQEVADQLIEAGVLGILNFAPIRLDVHDAVGITSVDFSVALEQLAFQISLGVTGSLEENNDS